MEEAPAFAVTNDAVEPDEFEKVEAKPQVTTTSGRRRGRRRMIRKRTIKDAEGYLGMITDSRKLYDNRHPQERTEQLLTVGY